MADVTILGKTVPFSFNVGPDAAGQVLDQAGISTAAVDMASAINAINWAAPYDRAFKAMNSIVFFLGTVPFGTAGLSRSFSDQPNGVFYWQAGEFLADVLPPRQATYYLHDCWHVVQYQDLGGASADLDEEVRREVEAMQNQIAVARTLNCDQVLIDFLTGYMNDRTAIETRIAQGFTAGAACTHCGSPPTPAAMA